MGVYYVITCDEVKEKIDPGMINDLGIKLSAIANPNHPIGPLVLYALGYRWIGKQCRLAHDSDTDPGYFEYKDVTQDVLMDYNYKYGTALRYTK